MQNDSHDWWAMQPGQDFEVVPGTEFKVSRTAQRSNKSDYYIDDRRSNFTEVTDMLKGKGIDLDNNRFLILQVIQNQPNRIEGCFGCRTGSSC